MLDYQGVSPSEYRRFLQDNAVQMIKNSSLSMNSIDDIEWYGLNVRPRPKAQ
jgi:hypothetical protein